jgi:hypothetical protein
MKAKNFHRLRQKKIIAITARTARQEVILFTGEQIHKNNPENPVDPVQN